MGELIAQQRKEIMLLKLKDMFDIIMLSSKYDSGLIQKSKSFCYKRLQQEKDVCGRIRLLHPHYHSEDGGQFLGIISKYFRRYPIEYIQDTSNCPSV